MVFYAKWKILSWIPVNGKKMGIHTKVQLTRILGVNLYLNFDESEDLGYIDSEYYD